MTKEELIKALQELPDGVTVMYANPILNLSGYLPVAHVTLGANPGGYGQAALIS